MARGLAAQFGSNCEVVVHEISERSTSHSVVAIENGHVSGRKLGDGPSQVVLEQLGKGNLSRLLTPADNKDEIEEAIGATVAACADMSRSRTGVLIVFERRERLGEIVATGTLLDADPSPELLKNIFFKNSPLHDGALIMRDGRICAAGCVLPLSGSQNLSRDLGTRHRAAVGMSESSDSVLVVVSEETGAISVAIGGMLKRHLSPEVLKKVLESELLTEEKPEKNRLTALRNIWKGGAGK